MGQKPTKNLKDAPVVLIIGGGYAGIKLAKSLDAECNVVLVDRKDYFLHNMGCPRGMVDTEFMKKCMIPYTHLLKQGHVVKGQVEKITSKEVHLQGQDVPITGFDYLVIATGTSYSFPFKVPKSDAADVLPLYEEVSKKIKGARNIVCVGAGSTGLEAATEIACKFPDKKITIVHSRAALFEENFKPAYGRKLEDHLKRGFPNVTLIKSDRLLPVESDGGEAAAQAKYVVPASGKVKTEKGLQLPCDLLFWSIGGRLNNASFKEHFGDCIENGKLKVDENLQVVGHPNIFAAGDICNAGPVGTVNFANQHTDVIAVNILAKMTGKAMKAFKPGGHMSLTQLGTTFGAACIPGPMGQMILGHIPVQKIKYDCFAEKSWGDLGFAKAMSDEAGKDAGKDADVNRLQDILNMDEAEIVKLVEGLNVEEDPAVDHT